MFPLLCFSRIRRGVQPPMSRRVVQLRCVIIKLHTYNIPVPTYRTLTCFLFFVSLESDGCSYWYGTFFFSRFRYHIIILRFILTHTICLAYIFSKYIHSQRKTQQKYLQTHRPNQVLHPNQRFRPKTPLKLILPPFRSIPVKLPPYRSIQPKFPRAVQWLHHLLIR